MGIVCTCSHKLSPLQAASTEAIKPKPPTILLTTVDPSFAFEAVRQELITYLEENKAYMSVKVVKLFQSAIESPEMGLGTLKLKLCKMRDVDWEHFSKLVAYGRMITKLFLWKMSLTTKGFTLLCSYSANLTSLQNLSLGDLGLGFHNFSQFAEALKRLTALTHLNLTVNELTPEHAEMLSGAIEGMTNLTECNLDENKIGDAGCTALRRAIKGLDKLELLSVRYNSITHIGCSQLLKASSKKHHLRVLLEGNEIAEEDWSRLQAQESV